MNYISSTQQHFMTPSKFAGVPGFHLHSCEHLRRLTTRWRRVKFICICELTSMLSRFVCLCVSKIAVCVQCLRVQTGKGKRKRQRERCRRADRRRLLHTSCPTLTAITSTSRLCSWKTHTHTPSPQHISASTNQTAPKVCCVPLWRKAFSLRVWNTFDVEIDPWQNGVMLGS